jgi:AcrR family transcriptional regulator
VAYDWTSKFGLESLTIGELAKAVGMSKSGLFGHFKSKERLQMMVLDFTAQNFTFSVIKPAIKKERGIPRIEAMVDNWIKWSSSANAGGCPFVAAAIEYDDRPGKIREHIQSYLNLMMSSFSKAVDIAIEEGQLKQETDPKQLAYEVYSLMIGFHVYSRLLGDKKAKQRLKNGIETVLRANAA